MEFDLFNGRGDGKHSGFGFVQISEIFWMQDTFFYETEPFDIM